VYFIPLINLVTTAVYLIVWAYGLTQILSVGDLNKSKYSAPYGSLNYSNLTYAVLGLHIFFLFWLLRFFDAATRFLLSNSVANWYYNTANCPVWESYWTLTRCNYFIDRSYWVSNFGRYCDWFQLAFITTSLGDALHFRYFYYFQEKTAVWGASIV
jgi:hypothetical protein